MLLEILIDLADTVFAMPPQQRHEGINAFSDAYRQMIWTGPLEVPSIVSELADRVVALEQQTKSVRQASPEE